MQVTIQPSLIKGTIQAPTSKSSMQRACAATLLAKDETIIKNPGHSNDDKAALGILTSLGCQWSMINGLLTIDSSKSFLNPSFAIHDSPLTINCGESGLGIRMFAPIIALSEKRITINGSGSLLTRPMDFFDEVLPQLGVEIISNNGKLPLQIKGPLQPQNIEIDGSLSSQFLTGLLMAFAASGVNDVAIKVNNLKSKPYIDLTLQVMKHFGWIVENKNYEEFYFAQSSKPEAQKSTINYTVEGDWSGGAFLLVAGAIAGNITVKGLDIHSTQADKKIIDALKDCGAKLLIENNQIEIGPSSLKAFHFDATDCPDLFPPLVALASYCNGTTTIKGVNRLAHKESDRAITLQEEFAKMGIGIKLNDDLMFINGNKNIRGTEVHSRHDHRIAMACAVAALRANGQTVIDEAQAINKSYPDFFDHIKSLGASVSLNNQFIN
jgi:3-phosphoshikimate 1-carboxyvinyltransferase